VSARRAIRFPSLGAALRRARQARPGLGVTALAKQLHWNQAKASLIEQGVQEPTEADVIAWAEAVGVDPGPLLAERDAALTRYLDVRAAARRPGGVEAMQVDVAAIEAGSTTITEYQPTLLPGLVQTPDYARTWLTQPGRISLAGPLDIELMIERRAQRQRRLAERALTVAVPAWVLDAVYGPTDAAVAAHVRQLDVLASMVRGGACELIVVDRPVALLHGFELLDDAVLIETVAGVQVLDDAEVVARFSGAMRHIRERGVTGDAALAWVAEARREVTSR
jgi:transcriptional regulator with XRE-family HTH domain